VVRPRHRCHREAPAGFTCAEDGVRHTQAPACHAIRAGPCHQRPHLKIHRCSRSHAANSCLARCSCNDPSPEAGGVVGVAELTAADGPELASIKAVRESDFQEGSSGMATLNPTELPCPGAPNVAARVPERSPQPLVGCFIEALQICLLCPGAAPDMLPIAWMRFCPARLIWYPHNRGPSVLSTGTPRISSLDLSAVARRRRRCPLPLPSGRPHLHRAVVAHLPQQHHLALALFWPAPVLCPSAVPEYLRAAADLFSLFASACCQSAQLA
jgi:hypothetical protein